MDDTSIPKLISYFKPNGRTCLGYLEKKRTGYHDNDDDNDDEVEDLYLITNEGREETYWCRNCFTPFFVL
jgi:hypothetical protein